jgi:hypothetical protein
MNPVKLTSVLMMFSKSTKPMPKNIATKNKLFKKAKKKEKKKKKKGKKGKKERKKEKRKLKKFYFTNCTFEDFLSL